MSHHTTCTTCGTVHDSGMDETVTACPSCPAGKNPFTTPRSAPNPSDLSASRAAAAERTRADRLKAAGEALEKCGLLGYAEDLYGDEKRARAGLDEARIMVSEMIHRLSDGSDEPRYAAAMTARDALGKLWSVL